MSDADREVALVASDMVVLTLRDDELHVALIRRAAATERGKWALPGGFMRRGESAEQAAYRELREEVGIAERDVVLEQIEILGKEVVPVLRKEFEARRPADVPSDPPTHASLVAEGPNSPYHLVEPAKARMEAQEARS